MGRVKKSYSYADFAAVLAALAAGFVTISEYEKRTLTTAVYNIKSPKPINKNRTLVFLTDLHDKTFGEDNFKLLNIIDMIKPDAVLVGGDMMICKRRVDIYKTLDLCERLTDKYPLYYANGNHELRMAAYPDRYDNSYLLFKRALFDMGAFYLSDSSAYLDDDIAISGLDIGREYYTNVICKKMQASYIENKLGAADRSRLQILLSHSPLFFDAYLSWGADITLSGHFHGGTIRLGDSIGLMTPQFQFFSDKVVGLKRKDNSYLIISSGLGTHSVNIRFNNKPQVVVVHIEK